MLIQYQPTSDQPWTVSRVVHLHRRNGFGASWNDIQRDLRAGPQAAVARLLDNKRKQQTSDAAKEFEQMSSVIRDAAVGSGDINRRHPGEGLPHNRIPRKTDSRSWAPTAGSGALAGQRRFGLAVLALAAVLATETVANAKTADKSGNAAIDKRFDPKGRCPDRLSPSANKPQSLALLAFKRRSIEVVSFLPFTERVQMTRLIAVLTVCCVFTNTAFLQAQEDAPLPGAAQPPEAQHQWLKQFVGEWKSHAEATAGPGEPAMQCEGTMSAKMLGEFWIVSEVTGETGGMTVQAIQTIGYDPDKKKYVGTWVDSMMNHMWHYEGTVDDSGKKLTLEAEGPNFMAAGKMTKFRDAYEFKSKDHIIATSSMQTEDGEWVTFMTGEMRRQN